LGFERQGRARQAEDQHLVAGAHSSHPNDYQTISDFLLNATRRLYLTGNTFALALRNDRNEVKELHLMLGPCTARLGVDGSIFYELTGNEIIERRLEGPIVVPARDVLHIKLHTPRHPLIGETPLQAAMLDVALAGLIGQQQVRFTPTSLGRPLCSPPSSC
jgi:phage portal protein BeeE